MVKLTRELLLRSVSSGVRRRYDEPVEKFLRRLTHAHLEGKGITSTDRSVFRDCPSLSVLYLFDNQLTEVPDLSLNRCLTHLYLQNNSITHMEGFDCLEKLRKLYLGGNSIAVLEGLAHLEQLEELHFENQHLAAGEQISCDPRSIQSLALSLKVLNISGNNITHLLPLGIDGLKELVELNVSDNQLTELDDLVSTVQTMGNLERLDMSRNKLCSLPRYRDKVIVAAPTIVFLDGKEVTETTNKFVLNWQASLAAANERKALRQQSSNPRPRFISAVERTNDRLVSAPQLSKEGHRFISAGPAANHSLRNMSGDSNENNHCSASSMEEISVNGDSDIAGFEAATAGLHLSNGHTDQDTEYGGAASFNAADSSSEKSADRERLAYSDGCYTKPAMQRDITTRGKPKIVIPTFDLTGPSNSPSVGKTQKSYQYQALPPARRVLHLSRNSSSTS